MPTNAIAKIEYTFEKKETLREAVTKHFSYNFKAFSSQVVQSLNDAIYILTIKTLPRNSLSKHSIKNICRLDRKTIPQCSLSTQDILFHCLCNSFT